MKRNILYFLITLTLFSCKTSLTPVSTNQWEIEISSDGSEPIARHEAAFVEINGKFYLLGGRRIQPVSIYDPNTKKWNTGAKPPLELHHFQPVVYKNKIYFIGAMTGSYPKETPVPNIYTYDVTLDQWEMGAEIPKERLRGSTGNVIINSKVYIAAGIKDGHQGDHKKWMDSYNLDTGTWEILPDAPRARDHFQAAEVNNNIYLVGGRQSRAPKETFKHAISEIDVYDIKTKKWTTLDAKLPTERAGNMAIAVNKYIFVVGGESQHQKTAHDEVEVLNTKKKTVESFPKLNRGRHGSGLIYFQNHIWVASGSGNKGGNPELTSIEKYEAH